MHDAAATETMPEQEAPRAARPASPAASLKVCPYCGHRERAGAEECSECRGLFEPLSLIATQNAMGPWQVRDEENPHRPGCSLETLRQLIRRGKVSRETVIRGPSTRQFWQKAGETRGVSHLLGVCHACASMARADHLSCRACGASFLVESDRNWLGLDISRPMDEPRSVSAGHAEAASDAIGSLPVTHSAPARPGFDLFQQDQGARPAFGAGVPTGRTGATPTRRVAARREAAAAAMVALCASVLSVAIWLITSAGGPGVAVAGRDDAGVQTHAAAPEAPAAVATPAPAGPPPATPELLEHWRTVLERVALLVALGDIESLEQAAKTLRQVQREAPLEARPDDLEGRIDALEAAIDDLTIKKFLR